MLTAKGCFVTMLPGCKFDGECKSKIVSKTNARGKRDSFHIFCAFGSTCNQQVYPAPKCEAPTVDTKIP